jgi:hypothetical protein
MGRLYPAGSKRGEGGSLPRTRPRERWRAAGREVLLLEATDPDKDLNDLVEARSA